jgi:nickel-dependent lactate racemase
MRKGEYYLVLPDSIYQNYEIIPHNCDDNDNLSYLGVTSRDTSVFINKEFYETDLKVVIGDIEPHHFAGFSGGVKSAAIGLGGRQTINQNHTLLIDNYSKVGNYYNNPLRQDIEEIGKMIGIDFAINAILDEDKKILRVFCGKPDSVMEQGIVFSKNLNLTPIVERFDLVIASAGGYPKDINFYQAQKALTHASLFCKKGAKVILVAECIEGIGSEKYLEFMNGMKSHPQVIGHFLEKGFQVGPHKAFQVAKIASIVNFKLYSSIDSELLSNLLIEPISSDLQTEITKSISALPTDARIAVIPYATATIPEYLEE